MLNQVNSKRIVKNTIFLYTKTFICMIIALYSTRLVLQALGNLDFGIYGTVGGAIAMLETLNLAMAQATQRFMNYVGGVGKEESLISIFNNTVLLHIGLGLIIVFLMALIYYPLFKDVFSIPADRMEAAKCIYLFLAISAFFTITTVPYDAMINAHEDFLYYSVVGIVLAVFKLVAAIVVFYWMNDRLILYGFLMAVIAILNMLIMRIYCKYKYSECVFNPKQYGQISVMKELGCFAGWNFIGAFSNIAGNHGSTILMNHFFGPIFITAKNIGDQICSQVAVLTSNMTKALNPVIVKSEGGGNRQVMLNLTFLSCRFSFLLYLLLAIPFLFNTEFLLSLWLKNIPDFAVLFCQLQVLRTLFEQLFTPLRTSLMAQGSVKQVNLFDLILSIITFVILFCLYKQGFQAQWHYYISILFLVFISGIYKIKLCANKCDMKIISYLKMVIMPSLIVGTLAFTFAYFMRVVIHNSIVLIGGMFLLTSIISFILGLSKCEIKKILTFMKVN